MTLLSALQVLTSRPLRIKAEYVHLILWLLLFLLSPSLIRLSDPTAAPIDPGILSTLLISVLAVLLFQCLTWWSIRLIWPVFSNYSATNFEQNFNNLQAWQRVLIYLSFYLFLLFSFVISFSAMY